MLFNDDNETFVKTESIEASQKDEVQWTKNGSTGKWPFKKYTTEKITRYRIRIVTSVNAFYPHYKNKEERDSDYKLVLKALQ